MALSTRRRRQKLRQLAALLLLATSRPYMDEVHLQIAGSRFRLFEGYFNSNSPQLDSYIRMDAQEFERLFHALEARLLHSQNHQFPILPRHRLVIFLRHLGHGYSFRALALEFGVGKTTCASIVWEISRLIIELLMPLYLSVPTAAKLQELADAFEAKWMHPRAVGALDGKHFAVEAPARSGSLYYNYKSFFSIVLLAISGPDLKFIAVDCGGSGRFSDSSLYDTSPLKDFIESATFPPTAHLGNVGLVPYAVLADAGFPLSSRLIRPYSSAQSSRSSSASHFNYCHSVARRVVENSFGLLVQRFRVFLRPLKGSSDSVRDFILSSIVLHNFLIEHSTHDCYQRFVTDHSVASVVHSQASSVLPHTAKVYRDRLAKFFASRDNVQYVQA